MLSTEVSIYILGNNFDDIAIQVVVVVVATMKWTLEHLNSCQLVCSTPSYPASRAKPMEPLRI